MRYQDLLAKKDFNAVIEDDRFYDASMNPKEKSSKHIRDVIIPELRAKAEYYKNKWSSLKDNNLKKRDIQKIINQKKRKEVDAEKKRVYAKAQTRINIRAMEMYFDKIKIHKLDRSNYLDGVLSYPIIVQWLKINNTLTDIEFRVLMVLYAHKWMLIKDAEYFGFNIPMFRKTMKSLIKKGFAQEIKANRKNAYSQSVNAFPYFNRFIRYQRKMVVKLFKELDAKQLKREGNNWLSYNGKILHNQDFYEATNFDGHDEGTD